MDNLEERLNDMEERLDKQQKWIDETDDFLSALFPDTVVLFNPSPTMLKKKDLN